MKIIVAGSNASNSSEVCRELGLYKLHSILNEKRDIENWDDSHFLMVDSGAHSWNKKDLAHVGMASKKKLPDAKEFLYTYIQFIKKHKDKKMVFVEFDVYNTLPYKYITDKYNEIMDIGGNFKLIRVYHEMLDGGSLDILRKWIDEGQDYIGVGADCAPIFDKIFSITKDKIKLHGFAMTKLPYIEKYPFWSVDSTSPLTTVIFGRYTTPIMNFKGREDVARQKSIECYHEDDERLRNALIETKMTQDYIDELWKKRGIEWKDLEW
jgi:hypothetical protein